jgi:hypothetical protein
MEKKKKKKILKCLLFFVFSEVLCMFLITTFEWRGNPPISLEEIPNALPPFIFVGVILTLYMYYKG